MLAQNTAGIDTPARLTEAEMALMKRVKRYQGDYKVSIQDLAEQTGIDMYVIGAMRRAGTGPDEGPPDLPPELRAQAFDKLSAWVAALDEQEEIVDRTLKRMDKVYTRTSLATQLDLDVVDLGLLLYQRNQWSASNSPRKQKLLEALLPWLESEEEGDDRGIASTPTFMRIERIYHKAWTKTGYRGLTGEVGTGKSFCARRFWRENMKTRYRRGVVYVELTSADKTTKAVLARIVEALYAYGAIDTTAGDHWTILCDHLGPEDLLIVDEFQFALADDIKVGKVFHDMANKMRTHVVLQGNRDLNRTLWGDKSGELEGVANRTLHPPHFVTTAADVTAWMEWAGYKDAALVKAATKIAARPGDQGGLRTLQLLFDEFESENPDKKLTAKSLIETAQLWGKYSPTNQKGNQ
ncbi:MAG: ATP-binding protein [Thiobacillus sp.]|nr:ATP-binding protein [Thiobacillus sp.]